MTVPLVEVEGLTVRFGDHVAVNGVDLRVDPGRCVALVGESGSGKSTIALALLGLTDAAALVSTTHLSVDGADATVWGEREWRRVRGTFAGLILQDALVSLDPMRSVRREVEEAVRAGGQPRSMVRDVAVQRLRDVGFPDPQTRGTQHAHQLSGGLRQRALIASALGGSPRLLIADEPTTALDVTVQRQVLDLLATQRAAGLGVLLVSHDLGVVADVADHVIVLRNGQVVEQGPPGTLLHRPRQAYTRALVEAIPQHPPRPAASNHDEHPVVLQAEGIHVSYRAPGGSRNREFTALEGVSLKLRRGRAIGVVGASGSGKSTLLRVLLAVQEPRDGQVLLDGRPWSGVAERERRERRRRVQVIPQDPLSSFDPRWTVRQILREALPRGAAESDYAEALDAVALTSALLDRRPLELSGGQRQRIAIARALAAQPEVLLCDEAVSALDVLVQAQILDLLERIRKERGVSIVFVSHDLRVVRQVSDEVLVLKDGRVVEHGSAEQVFEQPRHPYTRDLLRSLPGATEVEP